MLTELDVSKMLFKRAEAISTLVRSNFQDCIFGVWLSPSRTNTCAVEILIDTTLKAGELRRIALGEIISEIFDNERTADDTFDIYYLDTAIYNEEVESNREAALRKLANSFLIYLTER
jgi:hypothetical protein